MMKSKWLIEEYSIFVPTPNENYRNDINQTNSHAALMFTNCSYSISSLS